jgi:5'-nucleotidase
MNFIHTGLPILHLLLDADGNMLNWGGKWDKVRTTDFAEFVNLPLSADQKSFNLRAGLTPEEEEVVDKIFNMSGFYRDLEPLEGAVEAYHKMVERGHHVQFATSPWWSNPTCLQDKSESILEHFGEDARRGLILTNDKTTLRADYLFDDKPEIKGRYEPTWQQILYDQPYNQDIALPRITHWDQWEDVLEAHFESTIMDVMSL